MSQFLEQAKHNERFLAELEDKIPDDFFDWKITITYYAVLQYIKHYIEYHSAGTAYTLSSHIKIKKTIDPAINTRGWALDAPIFTKYLSLETLSRDNRYIGMIDPETSKIQATSDYPIALQLKEDIKNHFIGLGFTF